VLLVETEHVRDNRGRGLQDELPERGRAARSGGQAELAQGNSDGLGDQRLAGVTCV
jgi:hypothetical protein